MDDKNEHLTLEYVDHAYGRCQAILIDLDGSVLVDRIYKNRNSAHASIRARLLKLGLGDAPVTRVESADEDDQDEAPEAEPEQAEQAPTPAPASPTGRWLVKLRQEAQRALDDALELRMRAEVLEVEHKRLTAAADVLEGPEA